MSSTPKVTAMQVIPVAGYDSMLLNLSGAHAPFFTRNIVIIKDNAGHTGVGEIPGGARIGQTLEARIVAVAEEGADLKAQLAAFLNRTRDKLRRVVVRAQVSDHRDAHRPFMIRDRCRHRRNGVGEGAGREQADGQQ